MRMLTIFKLLLIIFVVSACTNQYPEMDPSASNNKNLAESKDVEDCKSNLDLLLADYDKKISEMDYAGASRGLERCAVILKDSKLTEKVNEAMAAAFFEIANNKNYTYSARKSSLDNLKIQYPGEVIKNQEMFDRLYSVLASEVEKQEAQDKKNREIQLRKVLVEEKRQRKMRGVSIGMTQEEVLQSSWGRPKDINRTTSSFGVREQWVYGNGNYLYFEDGILTTVQN